MLLAAAPRRLSVAAPRALRLRWRAAHGVAGGTGAAALAAARSPAQPKHHNRRSGPSAVAVAAAAAAAQGARSTSGVDPRRLLGFTVLDLTAGMAEVGVVDDVLLVAETGQAQSLLHVRAVAAPGQAAEAARDHLIPFVPQIVPSIDPAAGIVYIQPPPGLLDLGRQQALLTTLRHELAPFTHPPPLSLLSRMGLRVMPSSGQLAAAGRPDLVAAVRRAGGFLEVAQALGLRSQRKPAGYWDDEMHLDEELTLFVATHWTKFQDPESGQSYWYNQITHRISWEEPVMPQLVEIDDDGGYILTEAEEDRVMPSRSAVTAAGRYDLHHAIVHQGGYRAASQLLDRRPAWPPSQHLNSLTTLRQELRKFLAETGLPRNRMPTANQLFDAGRSDLHQAIIRRGGFAAAARALGWGTQRRKRQAWADVEAVVVELQRYILASQITSEVGQRRGSSGSTQVQAGQQAGPAADLPPLPPGARMPTHRELASAGRHDLKYAVQRHGSTKLAALLGLPLSKRGRIAAVDAEEEPG